ncbi:GtrA-like protein [Gramella sp. MAR_2010_147]|nr:GtrA-like protein [Gramella sp. MAR_2010_147]
MNFQFNRKLVSIFAGFSGVGVITTLISIGAIYLFIEVFQTPLILTYSIIYFSTILLSYFMNSLFVFKSPLELKKGLMYFLIYLSGMLIGVLMLGLLKNILTFEHFILAYIVLPLTMLWNFILSFYLFKSKHIC